MGNMMVKGLLNVGIHQGIVDRDCTEAKRSWVEMQSLTGMDVRKNDTFCLTIHPVIQVFNNCKRLLKVILMTTIHPFSFKNEHNCRPQAAENGNKIGMCGAGADEIKRHHGMIPRNHHIYLPSW